MRTLLAGVIGHVDHGKTALVKALTGIDTDRLKEEKERGLSIVLGFSHLKPGHDGEIDLIDMPGHERFLRTMISGATGIEAALLVVAANEGIKPQTVEHLEVARLIGVRRGIIAITKCDAASPDQAGRVAGEAAALAAANGIINAPQVFTSAVSGMGLEILEARLATLLTDPSERLDHGFCHLPIDRVFTAAGFGTVVTGTLRRGPIAVGDEVEVVPGGLRARVRGLQVHNRPVEAVGPGRRVAVNLRGVDRAELRRGHALSTPGALGAVEWLDARLELLASAGRPLENHRLVRLLLGTCEVAARVRLLDRDRLEPGDQALVQLHCAEPVAAPARDPFVIRTSSPARTVGGGQIIAPTAHRRRRLDAAVTSWLREIGQEHPPAALAAVLRSAGDRGCALNELGCLVGFAPGRLRPWLAAARAEIFHDGTILDRTSCADLENALLAHLDRLHRQHPRVRGMAKHALRGALPESVPAGVCEGILTRLAARGAIVQDQGVVRRRGFRPAEPSPDRTAALASGIEQLFRQAGLAPPDVAEVIGRDPRRARALRDLVRSGVLVTTLDRVQKREIVFHRDAIIYARRTLEEQLAAPEGFLVGEAGRVLGISRKFSIPLLEYLDAVHCTRRIADRRIITRPRPTKAS